MVSHRRLAAAGRLSRAQGSCAKSCHPDTAQTACSSRTPAPGPRLSKSCVARSRDSRGKAGGDKTSRMAVVSAKFESGQVFLPERAPWLADFEAELFAFPGAGTTISAIPSARTCGTRMYGLQFRCRTRCSPPWRTSREMLAALAGDRPRASRRVGDSANRRGLGLT